MTAWIALDRSDDECGALRLVPGTHAAEPVLIPHVQRVDPGAAIAYVADPALLDDALLASATTLTLEAGQLSLHDAMVLHGSGPNTSARRHAGTLKCVCMNVVEAITPCSTPGPAPSTSPTPATCTHTKHAHAHAHAHVVMFMFNSCSCVHARPRIHHLPYVRRAGVAATFMPAECHFYRDRPTEGALKGGLQLDFSTRPLFVVKGRNQHPENELVHDLVGDR